MQQPLRCILEFMNLLQLIYRFDCYRFSHVIFPLKRNESLDLKSASPAVWCTLYTLAVTEFYYKCKFM